jgi:tRNA threonylcarbamoyladenosine biosynthesis protein TsaB
LSRFFVLWKLIRKTMPYILNIESATDICSIAISQDDRVLALRETKGNHASQMTLIIESCLAEAQLQMRDFAAVAVSNGPGSYTSLRVGASVAKGICYALDIPMIAVDTLETLALAAFKAVKDLDALYCPMIDARRMEVYTAIFTPNTEGVVLIEPMKSLIVEEGSFDHFFNQNKRIVFCGNGAAKCQTVLQNERFIYFLNICSSINMIPFSKTYYNNEQFVDIAYYTPQYLKAPNITQAKKIL